MAAFASVLAAVACLIGSTAAVSVLPDNSFSLPINTFDSQGMRTIPGWRAGGSSSINEHFVRLTSDRQNKKGWLWNRNRMQSETWSATVKFRISGQGKRLFGDGLAFWFTTAANWMDGEVHGFTDTFTGFGVAFDTYVNSDPGHVHRDILLLNNDGTKSLKSAGEHGGGNDPNPTGCDADFRYWEGRQDFSPSQNTSTARIVYSAANNTVSLYIDPRSTGLYRACFTNVPLIAPSDWWRKGAYFGLTASTGDLADTHDVLSVTTTLEDEPLPSDLDGRGGGFPAFISTGDSAIDTAVRAAAARESGKLAEQLSVLKHDLEHDLQSVNDNLKVALKKVQDQEADSQKRIRELETLVQRLVEAKLDASIASRLERLEATMRGTLDARTASLTREVEASKSSWIVPVSILVVIIAAVSAFAYSRYRVLLKKHLL